MTIWSFIKCIWGPNTKIIDGIEETQFTKTVFGAALVFLWHKLYTLWTSPPWLKAYRSLEHVSMKSKHVSRD